MRYQRSSKVTWELVDERAVILDADGSTLTTLNAVGTLIWRDLDQPREAAELSRRLVGHFPQVDPRQLECDADEFLHLLAGDGLVVAAVA